MTPRPDDTSPSPDRAPTRRLGIRAKMILVIALPTLVIYVVVLSVMLGSFAAAERRDVERVMMELAQRSADGFDSAFQRAGAIARTTASIMEAAPDLTESEVYALLRANVEQDGLVFGAAMAFEPGGFLDDDSLFCPYVYRGSSAIESMNITRDVIDWYTEERWQWWHLPKASGTPGWTDPYFDDGAGNELMVTFSAPFTREGRFRGVTTVDIVVAMIRERIGAEIVGDTDFLILTGDGEFVYSPREGDIMSGRTVFDAVREAGRDDLAATFTEILGGSETAADVPAWPGRAPVGWEHWQTRCWVFSAPIPSTGWTFAAIVPERTALAPARARLTELALGLAATLALILACISIVAALVARPISRLAQAVRRIATGDLDHRIDNAGRDELGDLARDINAMAGDLKHHTEQIARTRSRSREAMIFAMARLAESRDDDTGKHLERISRYSRILAEAVAESDPTLDAGWVHAVAETSALHDIGKVGIPDAVLKKPGKLTDEERARMQSHTTIGGDALLDVRREWSEDDFLRTAAEIALGHHEHWDGKGYPYGLAGENISLSARIVAVADVYDALTSRRVYKPPMPHAEAVAMIVGAAGRQFDPRIIEAFKRVQDRFKEISDEAAASEKPR